MFCISNVPKKDYTTITDNHVDSNGESMHGSGMRMKYGWECNAEWNGDELWIGMQCVLECG